MKYLVLQRFRSMGVTFNKGEVVDDTFIRSPFLRQSEGKIIPAVSSFEVPTEVDIIEDVSSESPSEGFTIKEKSEQEEKPEEKKFSFNKLK